MVKAHMRRQLKYNLNGFPFFPAERSALLRTVHPAAGYRAGASSFRLLLFCSMNKLGGSGGMLP